MKTKMSKPSKMRVESCSNRFSFFFFFFCFSLAVFLSSFCCRFYFSKPKWKRKKQLKKWFGRVCCASSFSSFSSLFRLCAAHNSSTDSIRFVFIFIDTLNAAVQIFPTQSRRAPANLVPRISCPSLPSIKWSAQIFNYLYVVYMKSMHGNNSIHPRNWIKL